ncbi:hypothetical protein Rhopal_005729-T1 [Rhodotorula paludigena]|uniref:Uncharacterized protein n=1 Tax=Rhodotorula paludigena TaxID=86838 RepID=A0AAV5GQA6_9BASI|nr:hypothetical protein Rhopal_005729-T1 [Rhodotorula paludigena]
MSYYPPEYPPLRRPEYAYPRRPILPYGTGMNGVGDPLELRYPGLATEARLAHAHSSADGARA